MANTEVRNVHGQEGQGSWAISLLSAFVIVCAGIKNPNTLPFPDPLIDAAKEPVSAAAQHVKKQVDSVMTAIGISPTIGHAPR